MVGVIEFGNVLKVELFKFEKCNRCWNYFLFV